MNLHTLTIAQAQDLLAKKEISSVDLTRAFLDRIDKYDNTISAFITVDPGLALKQAEQADQMIAKGKSQAFTGIPVALKDVLCTKGVRTTCASKILEHFVPQYDATVVEKFKAQDAVLIGKANMDEFAMGSSTENSAFFVTRNPWDTDHVPGGSSGGSAAAVAARFCAGAVGTDTGGSIRQPASHCGVVGLKPTYGRVSRFGVVAYASSLDQVGPITRDVTDAAMMLNLMGGHDPKDSTSAPEQMPDFTKGIAMFKEKGLSGMTLGIPREFLNLKGIDPEVKTMFESARKTLEGLGVTIKEISLPHSNYAVAAYYIIAPCEASANLARFDGVRYGYRDMDSDDLIEMYKKTKSKGFGPEVQRRIIIGTYSLSSGYYDAYYGRASQVRALIMDDFKRAFDACDIILSPVAPTPAFKIGEKVEDPLTMYLSDIFTLSCNLAGIPGISVPAGISSTGLPMGLQMMSRHFDEMSLIRAGYGFEQAVNHIELPEF
ncbi:Asp-tRNA(Asn)/Glu-tRNA(Gln) amidotransferase subunit GatA [Desulfobacter latus]|uniref:Glutamyl-tRNA(Gln) amidotransferase subunit A n=1 Tax=Desulfobacter latus TaxID=2292 RepID=A0A850T5J5_9BACT|nr:Asp-tRNA(Asn)/Glu-tRNA(Gln) amidotransferase subunit GatA [Desulfobacter latus]NWH04582.1 Asp-tRNA(Asn)/Glu-tRNA(Gln) amidotransferase subunit GatA [Desulfobacter latus]